jgi:hypothetical protein
MGRVKIGMLAAVLSLVVAPAAFAAPGYMWIGTYAINNSPPPFGWMSSWATVTADSFFTAAAHYSSIAGGPIPHRVLRRTETDVTITEVIGGNRELCDFIFVGTRGHTYYSVVWNAQVNYHENWYPTQKAFGTGNVRWAYLTGSRLLQYNGSNFAFANVWRPAMRGVQCILGYGSVGYLAYFSPGQVKEMWRLWTEPSRPHSIWLAHAYSTGYFVYTVGGFGIEAAIISSLSDTGQNFSSHTYARATLARGDNSVIGQWAVYGTPQY